MTDHESNPFGDDVLKALRASARAGAPAAARARVAARLTTAGAGLVTGAASAAAAASAKATGAASLSALALSKTFAVGMLLGVGTAVSAHSLGERSATEPRAHSGVADTRPAEVATVPRAAASAPAATVQLPAAAAVNPIPELPRSTAAPTRGAPTASSPRLAEQQALLDAARVLLRTGDPAGALAAVQRHKARFPRTMFEEEREALAIRALSALARHPEARARTEAFARRFPGSLALPALRKSVDPTRGSVTEAAAPPQTPSVGSALR
jgi:hypothetical protein